MANPSRNYEFSSNNVIPFDPLRYAKQLEKAGFTREQAEVQAETFFGIVHENLVTKRDLKELENQLVQTIKELEIKASHDIKESENKMTLELENIRRDIKALEIKTSHDIKELENRLVQTIKELEIKTSHEIKESENKMTLELENIRRDIKELESKTALEFESMRLSTKSQIELLRRDLKIWFGSMLVTVIVAFSTLLTVLPHVIGR